MEEGGLVVLRIAIVEDDASQAKRLEELLRRYGAEHKQALNLQMYNDGSQIISPYTANHDIILMDIQMPETSGIEAAREIRKLDSEVVIIFITNVSHYAMEGYKVDALDYVLKPIDYFPLVQRIDRAVSRMKRHTGGYLTIKERSGVKKIPVENIVYVEVQDHYSIIHLADSEVRTKESLSSIEKRMDDPRFFRSHKWFVINLEYVDQVHNLDVVVGSRTLQVSRSRRKNLLDKLNDYIHEVRY